MVRAATIEGRDATTRIGAYQRPSSQGLLFNKRIRGNIAGLGRFH